MESEPSRSVTFETQCWEKDWQPLLLTDRLEAMARRNCYPFSERVLLINNVSNSRLVCSHAEQAIQKGYLTKYVVVEDYAGEVLRFFGLKREDFGKGYYYSIAELVGIYLCQSEFLLHYTGDALPARSINWLPESIELFENDSRIRVANLLWNNLYEEAEAAALEITDSFYVGFGFSDQCYLIRSSDFRARIYAESHSASERYPEHAGESFEKRVDSWMRNHNYLRATSRRGSYLHINF